MVVPKDNNPLSKNTSVDKSRRHESSHFDQVENKLDDVFDTLGTDEVESEYFTKNQFDRSSQMTQSKRFLVDTSSEVSLNQQLESVSSESDDKDTFDYDESDDDRHVSIGF